MPLGSLPKINWVHPLSDQDFSFADIMVSPDETGENAVLRYELAGGIMGGKAPVYAPLGGEVTRVDKEGDGTSVIEITKTFPNGDRIVNQIRQLHPSVKKRDKVKRGEVIGTSIYENLNDYDLDWRVFYNDSNNPSKGEFVNPLKFALKTGGLGLPNYPNPPEIEAIPLSPTSAPKKGGNGFAILLLGALFAFSKKGK
jgi:hypothetical protein